MHGCVVANVKGHPYKMDALTLSVPNQNFNGFLIPEFENLLFWNKQEHKPNREETEFEVMFSDGSFFKYEEENKTLFVWSKKHQDEFIFEDVIFLHDLQIKVFATLEVFVEFKTSTDEK